MRSFSALTFDIATSTGWAAATEQAVAGWPVIHLASKPGLVPGVSYGRLSFKGPSNGHKFDAAVGGFEALLRVHRPDIVCFEAPITPGNRSIQTARLLLSFAAMLEYACQKVGCGTIRCFEEDVRTVRKTFVGNGNCKKHEVPLECRRRGWPDDQGDICDALAVLHHTIVTLRN